jgi:hypothetical protein
MELTVAKLDDEFRAFLDFARAYDSKSAASSANGARLALNILSKLPIARDAVLELFSTLFYRVVQYYLVSCAYRCCVNIFF